MHTQLMVGWFTFCQLVPSLLAEQSGDDLPAFDEQAVAWDKDEGRFQAGLLRAEAFRRRLLEGAAADRANARLVGRALEVFRKRYQRPLPDRPTLSQFNVTAEAFLAQVRSENALDAEEVFAAFAGRWYGTWDELRVDHHWHPVKEATAPNRVDGRLTLVGQQFAWIGDGFGWNYLARPNNSSGSVVLGYVYHLQPHEPQVIRSEFPLVGYHDGPRRLIWVTPFAVFLEQSFAESEHRGEHYAITGFNYKVSEGRLDSEGQGFQAVYTRKPDVRPEWKRFPLSISVRP